MVRGTLHFCIFKEIGIGAFKEIGTGALYLGSYIEALRVMLLIELRAQFIMESIADLRDSLRQRGLDLIVRQGKPEDIVPLIAKSIGAHTVMPLYRCYTHHIESFIVKPEHDCGSYHSSD